MGESEEYQVELRFAARALREMEAAKRWWLANREKNTSLFELELAEVFDQIKTAPLLGMHFQMHRGREIRYVVTLKSK